MGGAHQGVLRNLRGAADTPPFDTLCYNLTMSSDPARHRPATASRNTLAHLADRFGATASFLCAIHCALLPLVVAVLPVLGLSFLADHRYEQGFIVFATALALTSLFVGFRRHQRFGAFWFLVPGITLLLVGAALAFDDSSSLHAVLVAIGGTLVACAHVANLRLSHGHVHDATCQH